MTDYQVITRELEIAATPTEIAAWISDFRRWVTWSPWEELDPNLSRAYSGPESGIGAHYAWSGNKKAGQGTMEITAVEPKAIKIDLTFLKPFKSASKTEFEFVDTEVGTKVVWQVRTPKTLMARIAGIFINFEKTVGADLEKGLGKLKVAVENPR